MPARGPELQHAERIRRIGQELGPACRRAMEDPAFSAAVGERVGHGASLEDAVLGALFARQRQEPAIGAEILAHLARGLQTSAAIQVPRGLRHAVGSSDLLQSVLGDLCASLADVEYRSKAQFLALLGARLRWKRLDHQKRLGRHVRREAQRASDERLEHLPSSRPSPVAEILTQEEAAEIALAIQRMPERDRLALRLTLRGESHTAIAAALGLTPEASRKALERARTRLRGLLDRTARSSREAS